MVMAIIYSMPLPLRQDSSFDLSIAHSLLLIVDHVDIFALDAFFRAGDTE
jgi:hypothetical protein